MGKCKTQILRVDPDGPDYAGHITRAGRLLREGRLVAFPTETVYGLAANAEREDALAALRAVKGRPEGKPFTFIICEQEEVERRVGHVPPSVRALMGAFWPGPLTIVLPAGEAMIGFRMPDHRAALDLIRAAGVRLVAPSANRSGGAEPGTAEDVMRELGGAIPLILDGGHVRLGRPSTVVRVSEDSCEVLRAGAIEEEEIRNVIKERS
ncbi:MAG: L-threonylcarbamoyladenylate synthase [Planctomycetota bacterium]